jgi:hypothetical protein
MSNAHVFWAVLMRDPYLFLGLVLLGVPAVAYWRIYSSLREIGFKRKTGFILPAFWWGAYAREYAQPRSKFGWPAWPLHAGWIGFVFGVPLLIVGITKL